MIIDDRVGEGETALQLNGVFSDGTLPEGFE